MTIELDLDELGQKVLDVVAKKGPISLSEIVKHAKGGYASTVKRILMLEDADLIVKKDSKFSLKKSIQKNG